MQNQPQIKSILKNGIKVLVWMPGNNIHDYHFSGINFINSEGVDKAYSTNDLSAFKSIEYDYFFIHGYQIPEFNLDIFNDLDIKIKNFCIDILGEGFDIDTFLRSIFTRESALKLKSKIKILIPFDHYNGLELEFPEYDFFKADLGGPKIFCSRYNDIMIHGTYLKTPNGIKSYRWSSDEERFNYPHLPSEIVYGLNWSDEPKEKLFMCLMGAGRDHRVMMFKSLIQNRLLENGYVTFQSKSIKYNIKIGENGKPNNKISFSLPNLTLNERMLEDRFSLHTPISKNCYVELVAESSHTKLPFKTEKCVKPFYNLQFPIILGHQGIVNDLRKNDFDMFDDIIDHSYDDIPVNSTITLSSKDVITKTNMISSELLKLKNIDIHSLYLKNKERFLYNQENLYNKTVLENDIFQKLGKFIFGNDVEVIEIGKDKIEKIII